VDTQKHLFEKITAHLYVYEDTCNVYVLVKDEKAVLIDFGNGAVLNHLGELGVKKVSAILHTHHHRDQCQGDYAAIEKGIPIFVPALERRLFDQAELFWSTKQLWDMYNVRNTFFTLTRDVQVAGTLDDFRKWKWEDEDYEFFVLPTPGHTLGSVTLISRIDGRSVAFSGDLIYAPGKVLTLFDMQYDYGSTDGVETAILSLKNLARRSPDTLCPSHGQIMHEADKAIGSTRENLIRFFSLMNNGLMPADEIDLTVISPHLLAATYACAHFYVLLSDDGHALFVDFGAPNFTLFDPIAMHFEPGERVRFLEHSLERLTKQYGVKKIEAVLPSHYHDDHVNGIPYLQSQLGVECWAYENMKEILEHPENEQIGCVTPDPITVHKTFKDGASLKWRGYDFAIHYTPGHADYHMSMFGDVDGKTVGFTGDNLFIHFFPLQNSTPSLIYRNHVHKTSHQITAQRLLEYMPEIICGGHELQREVKPQVYDLFMRKARELTQHFETLLPGETNFGLEPSWVQICPYQSSAKAGDILPFQIRALNFLERPVDTQIKLVLPHSWHCEPPVAKLKLLPLKQTRFDLKVTIPNEFESAFPRLAIAADVTFDNRYLGQITEAVVHLTS
jgi:glyoxylase-like metal-dependent hydrolase (beta-lactamase superfamily II)